MEAIVSIPETLEKAVEESKNKLIAVYIAVLAVLLAICSIGDDEASKSAVRANILAANTYAFFQAKNIRQTSYKLAADEFELRLLEPDLSESTRAALNVKIQEYRATAKRYDSEPETGDGKKELLEKAKNLESERDVALQRDPYFDLGQGLLQIAIVLASVSLIVGGSFLLWVSGVLAVVGIFSTINAFTLAIQISFMA